MKRSEAIQIIGKVLTFGKDGFPPDKKQKYEQMSFARQVLKELESEYEKTQSEKLVDDLNAYAKQALKELDAKKGLREH